MGAGNGPGGRGAGGAVLVRRCARRSLQPGPLPVQSVSDGCITSEGFAELSAQSHCRAVDLGIAKNCNRQQSWPRLTGVAACWRSNSATGPAPWPCCIRAPGPAGQPGSAALLLGIVASMKPCPWPALDCWWRPCFSRSGPTAASPRGCPRLPCAARQGRAAPPGRGQSPRAARLGQRGEQAAHRVEQPITSRDPKLKISARRASQTPQGIFISKGQMAEINRAWNNFLLDRLPWQWCPMCCPC
jgi:hypothetical protein